MLTSTCTLGVFSVVEVEDQQASVMPECQHRLHCVEDELWNYKGYQVWVLTYAYLGERRGAKKENWLIKAFVLSFSLQNLVTLTLSSLGSHDDLRHERRHCVVYHTTIFLTLTKKPLQGSVGLWFLDFNYFPTFYFFVIFYPSKFDVFLCKKTIWKIVVNKHFFGLTTYWKKITYALAWMLEEIA